MTQYINPNRVLMEMNKADKKLILLSAVVFAISWPLRGIRYRDILAAMDHYEEWEVLTGAIFISQTANLVVPARAGDGVRAYVLKMRKSIPYTTGFASLTVERIFDLLTLSILSSVFVLGLSLTGSIGGLISALGGQEVGSGFATSGRTAIITATAVAVAVIMVIVAIIASIRTDRNFVEELIGRMSNDSYVKYVTGIIETFIGDIHAVPANKRTLGSISIVSIIIWSVDVLTALVVFAAFGYPLTPSIAAVGFLAVSVGNLAKVLPLSPGGIGLYEGAFTLIITSLTPIGVATTLGIAVIDHAVKNTVAILGGLLSIAWLNISLTTAVEEAQRADDSKEDLLN